MANYNSLKATIDAQIKANGVQAITGPILNAVLTAMINTIGNGYTLQGSVAQTTDNPGAPDNPVAYLAAGPGTYTNFGGTVIPDDGHAYLLTWDTSWHAVQLPLPTFDLANGKQDALTFDDAPTPGSDNPVKSNGIAEALDDKQDKDTGDTAGHVAVMDGNGNSVDGGEALADLATKEDVEAVEQEVAQIAGEAGLAEAVIDTDNAGTEQEFTFRKSGGDGGAYYRKIKGKTIAWNQLIPVNALGGITVRGVTYTNNGDGSITVDGTASGGTSVNMYEYPFIAGHKYYIPNKWTDKNVFINANNNSFWDVGTNGIFIASTQNVFLVGVNENAQADNVKVYPQLIDLTLEGIADEISTPADFDALYPGYHEHNPGTLISNDAEAVETTGVNQWDEEWEAGGIRGDNGQPAAGLDNIRIRSKNFCPCLPNTAYNANYVGNSYGTSYPRVFWYDANKNYISSTASAGVDISPANAAFFKINTEFSEYGNVYNHDICINLSNPAINGQYFPYWKRTLQLGITTRKDTDGNVPFADGMKGAGTAADWADKVGGEKRMGRVDLGSLNWYYFSGDGIMGTNELDGLAKGISFCPGVCSRLSASSVLSASSMENNSFVFQLSYSTVGTLTLKVKTTETDPAAFKAAMSGVYLYYELATPVPFTWAEPLNLGVKVDENGTERAVAPEGATVPSAPFVADTTYTMSVARMVAKLQSI